MRLTFKLSIAIAIGIVLIFSVDGYLRIRRQVQTFENDMKRDHAVMGRALATAISEIWTAGGKDEALDLLEKVNKKNRKIELRWIEPDGLAPEDIEALKGGQTVSRIARAGGEKFLLTLVPVVSGGAMVAVLEINESLTDERDYIRSTAIRVGIFTLLTIIMCSIMVLAIGVFFVGRPMRRLMDKARRVGRGDFSGRLEMNQKDEIGRLAEEMNLMSERLADADIRIEAEKSARREAVEQLRHADRLSTVGKLASSITHEIGTPLNVISGRADMIAAGEAQGEEISENARIISEQSGRIAGMIRRLLDFARRRGREKPRADLLSIVEKTATLLMPMAKKQGVSIEHRADSAVDPIPADESEIQQVLMNLALNGIQAMPGGGTLTIAVRRERARRPGDNGEEGGSEGDYACIDVADEGGGIAESDLPHLFTPFYTTKDAGEGTGLGLSVAAEIVREHDGWIEVESEKGRGSRFKVYLPMQQEETS
ncbi:MAG: ATP-binding protein [Pseudomonadota bacterium]